MYKTNSIAMSGIRVLNCAVLDASNNAIDIVNTHGAVIEGNYIRGAKDCAIVLESYKGTTDSTLTAYVRNNVIVGVTESPIADYQSQDDQPVRVIVFTVAPDEDSDAYLRLLGSISRKLRNGELVESLIMAMPNTAKIYETIQSECKEEE